VLKNASTPVAESAVVTHLFVQSAAGIIGAYDDYVGKVVALAPVALDEHRGYDRPAHHSRREQHVVQQILLASQRVDTQKRIECHEEQRMCSNRCQRAESHAVELYGTHVLTPGPVEDNHGYEADIDEYAEHTEL